MAIKKKTKGFVVKRPKKKLPPEKDKGKPWSTVSLVSGQELPEMATDVALILSHLDEVKTTRRQMEVASNLKLIHGRVERALAHVGLSTNIHSSPSEVEATVKAMSMPVGFSTDEKKKQLQHQQTFQEMIGEYFERCKQCIHIMDDLNEWLISNVDLGDDVPTEEEIERDEVDLKQINKHMREALDFAEKTGGRLASIGNKLMKDSGSVDVGDEDGRKKKKPVPPKTEAKAILIDEESMEGDFSNLNVALSSIKQVLEESVRHVKTNQAKSDIRTGLKQMKAIVKAVNQRQELIQEKEEEILQLNMKINQMSNGNDRLREKCEAQEREINSLTATILKLEADTKDLQAANQTLQSDLEAKDTQTHTASLPVITLSSSTLQNNLTKNSKESYASVQSMLKEDNEDFKNLLESQNQKIAQLEKQIKAEKEAVCRLEVKLEAVESMPNRAALETRMRADTMSKMNSLHKEKESLERQIAQLKAELNIKNELIEYQDRRMKEMMDELMALNTKHLEEETAASVAKTSKTPGVANCEVKRVVVRMKKEYEMEIVRLKTYMEKEKQRFEAEKRRLEQNQKEQLAGIHRESVHLLRAINRFKDSVAQILEKENLQAAANDVRNMPVLQTEQVATDAKVLLGQMAGSAVELLVALEFKLTQALINKRLQIKDNSIAKTFATKDLEAQIEASQKAKQLSDQLTEKLKQMKVQLATVEDKLRSSQKAYSDRNQDLRDRYSWIRKQYGCLQHEMQVLQKDYATTLKNKEALVKGLQLQKEEAFRIHEHQNAVIMTIQQQAQKTLKEKQEHLGFVLHNQHHNMQLLEKHLSDNKISHDMHMVMGGMIHQCMSLTRIRLRNLFERYITFCKLRDTRDQMKVFVENKAGDKKEELEENMNKMVEQLSNKTQVWQDEQNQLEDDKRRNFEKMNIIFQDLMQQSEILQLLPEPKSCGLFTGDRKDRATRPANQKRRKGFILPKLEAPKGLVGMGLIASGPMDTLWKPASLPPLKSINVSTPKLLDLDVNLHMRAAQRTLKSMVRPTYPLAYAEAYDYKHLMLHTLDKSTLDGVNSCQSEDVNSTTGNTSLHDTDGQRHKKCDCNEDKVWRIPH